MKTLILVSMLFLTACGGAKQTDAGAPALAGSSCHTLEGHYVDPYTPTQTIDIAGNCTFTDSVCGYTASYTVPDENTGATIITVAGTNGTPGCMSSTAHTCVSQFLNNQLGINCDNGAHLYLFNKQ